MIRIDCARDTERRRELPRDVYRVSCPDDVHLQSSCSANSGRSANCDPCFDFISTLRRCAFYCSRTSSASRDLRQDVRQRLRRKGPPNGPWLSNETALAQAATAKWAAHSRRGRRDVRPITTLRNERHPSLALLPLASLALLPLISPPCLDSKLLGLPIPSSLSLMIRLRTLSSSWTLRK